ncbi:MAG: LuxR family quorum-sensing system transcriptional regulator SolR [Motiliproteus sp.]|jgi:LuxR family quorum-sensing system transcriptional regulator SolR
MDFKNGNLFEPLLLAETLETFSDLMEKLARQIGFDHFAFGLKSPYPLTSPKTQLVNNYPQQWQKSYSDNKYLAIDPTVQHGLRSTQPLIWKEDLYTFARPMWEEARSFGLNHGWAQAYRDAHGNIGMLTLVRSNEIISTTELIDKSAQLSWLTQQAHASFSNIMHSGTQKDTTRLTQREIEILRWTAEGKTSSEAAIILNITTRTVNFHLNNASAKFGSANKTAAVVQAALMGLLA